MSDLGDPPQFYPRSDPTIFSLIFSWIIANYDIPCSSSKTLNQKSILKCHLFTLYQFLIITVIWGTKNVYILSTIFKFISDIQQWEKYNYLINFHATLSVVFTIFIWCALHQVWVCKMWDQSVGWIMCILSQWKCGAHKPGLDMGNGTRD